MRRLTAVILWIITAMGPRILLLCDAFSALEQCGFARSSRCRCRLGHRQHGDPFPPPPRPCRGYGRFGSEYPLSSSRHRRLTSVAIDKEENVSEDEDAYNETLVTDSLSSSWSSSSQQMFANFDYQAHWYPVIWARDLRLQEPTKVTVFDVDYVVARTSDTEVICLHNVCPHKAAALSQGRVTDSGNFQCAYHGWSFDGQTGACVEIPQLVVDNVGYNMNDRSTMDQQRGGTLPRMPLQSQATAVPAQIHQEMVWIFPGGNLEQALQAPPPPSIPEYAAGYQINGHFMRDFPHVDWTIVLSNVCDADHGLFAHQAKGFDKYSASREHPMRITHESFPHNGKGWIVESQVDGIDKILLIDQEWRRTRTTTASSNKKKGKHKGKQDEADQSAFMYFHAPSFVQWKRIEKSSIHSNNDKTAIAASTVSSFSAVFWICPVGVGKSRFMSAAVVKKPVPLLSRRWITKLILDNFLDQDTYLLATQQQYILGQEARDLRQALLMSANKEKSLASMEGLLTVGSSTTSSSGGGQTRRNLFCLCSPSEKLVAKLEQFWDTTLWKSPNRVERLLQLQESGTFTSIPSRQTVLDRQVQYLEISPDAQDVVRNCRRISIAAKCLGVAMAAATGMASFSSTGQTALFLGRRSSVWVLLSGSLFWGAAAWVAEKVRREYYFKYTDDMRRRDLKTIPKRIWMDK